MESIDNSSMRERYGSEGVKGWIDDTGYEWGGTRDCGDGSGDSCGHGYGDGSGIGGGRGYEWGDGSGIG